MQKEEILKQIDSALELIENVLLENDLPESGSFSENELLKFKNNFVLMKDNLRNNESVHGLERLGRKMIIIINEKWPAHNSLGKHLINVVNQYDEYLQSKW